MKKHINIIFKNHLEKIQKGNTSFLKKYCPKCKSRLKSVQNTVFGIPYMTVIYCPECGWTLSDEKGGD
jgi:ribosomal protein S27E